MLILLLTGKPKLYCWGNMVIPCEASSFNSNLDMDNKVYYFEKDGIEYQSFIHNGKREVRISNRGRGLKHGMCETRLYNIWKNMRKRCNNPNNTKYKWYGGKGINVCPEWDNADNGFINFKKWALENGYSDNLTIDRKDSFKDYCPENCRWITLSENIKRSNKQPHIQYIYTAINEEENIIVTFYQTKCFKEKYNINSQRISDCCTGKLKSYKGWRFSKRLLNEDERQETIRKEYNGELLPLEVRNIHD